MTTALTLAGFNLGIGDQVDEALTGYANRADKRIVVRYSNLSHAVKQLDVALRALGGQPCEIVAHSRGCEVVGDWLNLHAACADAPPITRIILLGNPERRCGLGYAIGGGKRTPTTRSPLHHTRYQPPSVPRLKSVYGCEAGSRPRSWSTRTGGSVGSSPR